MPPQHKASLELPAKAEQMDRYARFEDVEARDSRDVKLRITCHLSSNLSSDVIPRIYYAFRDGGNSQNFLLIPVS